ncbi:phosphotransferase [Streptomyces sp. SID12488]|nr:phosphotransferase [Streptomyces sp. SID12488]
MGALLRQYAAGSALTCDPVDQGLLNRGYRLATTRGHYFLKHHFDPETADPAAIARQHRATQRLADLGVPVAPPLPGRDGRTVAVVGGHAYALHPWVDGRHRHGGQLSTGQCGRLGALLGVVHASLERVMPTRCRAPGERGGGEHEGEADGRHLTVRRDLTAPRDLTAARERAGGREGTSGRDLTAVREGAAAWGLTAGRGEDADRGRPAGQCGSGGGARQGEPGRPSEAVHHRDAGRHNGTPGRSEAATPAGASAKPSAPAEPPHSADAHRPNHPNHPAGRPQPQPRPTGSNSLAETPPAPSADPADTFALIDELLAHVRRHQPTDAFDELARHRLLERRALLEQHADRRPPPGGSVGWVHGDFHPFNLLYKGDAPAAIVDWDRLGVQPRAEEAVRGAAIFFVRPTGTLDLPKARAYARAYRRTAGATPSELAAAVHRVWWERLNDFWMLRWHYERGDTRADSQFPAASALAVWWTREYDAVCEAFVG